MICHVGERQFPACLPEQAAAAVDLMSFFHPELSQGPARFDRPGRGSFRWFRELFEHLRDTALPTASASQPGNDQALSRGAQGGERGNARLKYWKVLATE